MNYELSALPAGLYLVATPIGAARDITLRALDILASADILAAEDTRTLKHLLSIHGVPLGDRPVLSYHDHSAPDIRRRLISEIAAGRSVAYASEAGTPMISDPGFDLARDVAGAGGLVTTAPGPSAAIAALTLAGLPTDRFLFAGFLSAKQGARRRDLADLAGVGVTVVLYESPRRVEKLLADIVDTCGADRPVALCRELTKRFEEVQRGPAAEVLARIKATPPKGEIVVLIGPGAPEEAGEEAILDALRALPNDLSLRDAAAEVAERLGAPRRAVYRLALALREDQG
ncbi:MAG: 16S rRNA (cytidine(1402)-2'-O)-methyltransferase [Qingshengfaniella sp.]